MLSASGERPRRCHANFLFQLVTAVFVACGISLNWGGILLMVLMMLGAQWYILFNTFAGAQAIPSDLREATADIRLGGSLWWRRFGLRFYVTGGITAAGGA